MSSRPSDRRIEVFFMGTSFQRPGLATGAAWLLRSGPCVSGRRPRLLPRGRLAASAALAASGFALGVGRLPTARPEGQAGDQAETKEARGAEGSPPGSGGERAFSVASRGGGGGPGAQRRDARARARHVVAAFRLAAARFPHEQAADALVRQAELGR